MSEHTSRQYKTLIANMPVNQHCVTIKAEVWQKYCGINGAVADLIRSLFDRNEVVDISRGDLLESSKSDDTQRFILKTLLWAYPSGGQGNNVRNVLKDLARLVTIVDEVRSQNTVSDWLDHFKGIQQEVNGLGLSTYSKFLYFMGTSVNGYPALILDGRLMDALNKRVFEEFHGLKELGYNNAYREYVSYLDIMHGVAGNLGVDPDKLEMFLFFFGGSLKSESGSKSTTG